jgi:hypothetical protein
MAMEVVKVDLKTIRDASTLDAGIRTSNSLRIRLSPSSARPKAMASILADRAYAARL